MKIRKANVQNGDQFITNVYIYENKKEEYSLIAVPEIEWSTIVEYVESRDHLRERLNNSLGKAVKDEVAEELATKMVYWVGEM
ncbi:YueH family protein [Virgibacillus sp. 6R]|uniref:YueH family protein n=1 Tax=Metabacillus sp. 22489 TaxID=3453928 RepID=UPI0011A00AD5